MFVIGLGSLAMLASTNLVYCVDLYSPIATSIEYNVLRAIQVATGTVIQPGSCVATRAGRLVVHVRYYEIVTTRSGVGYAHNPLQTCCNYLIS